MAQGKRSAISKSMGRKKAQTATSHVSGLSSARSSVKRKEAPVRYGQLSRKQKQDLLDYGELVPQDFQDDEENVEDDSENKKRRRVIDEDELDRELEEERERMEGRFDSSSEEEEEEWQKPSAYSMLVGSLKKTSKNQSFYEKIQREQEGIEDVVEQDDDEDGEEYDEEEEVDDDVSVLDQGSEEEDSASAVGEEEDDDDMAAEEDIEKEEEEEEEEEMMIGYESSDDEDKLGSDRFETRFGDKQSSDFDNKITLIEQKKWITQGFENDSLKEVVSYTPVADKTVMDDVKITGLEQVQVKEKLARHWKEANEECLGEGADVFTPLQEALFSHMNHYRDMLYCNRTIDNAAEIRNTYVLHALNHVMKTRDRILKNNSKIAKAQKEEKEIGEYRDQGFTRPRVLIVLPFRNTVVEVVNTLIKLSGSEQQENKKRFYEQFSLRDDDAINEDKPADFLATFKGNIDDHFRLPIKITRKTIKFYSELYSSDIIIASPLGLRTLIGTEGDHKREFDFLSSIELVIFDQANHFLMQNWEHIEHLCQHLNLIPSDAHGCDISRIKSWYLDGKAPYLRQTLAFSEFLSPELNALFNKYFKNITGKLRIKQTYEGSIVDVIPQVQQTFTRIDTTSLAAMDDARFKYFIDKTLPTLRKSAITQSHTLIFIPSYFDFVRLRNYFEDNKYTSPAGIARARSQFFHGRTNFLLYTERIHFFRRFNIRGTFHVVFYGLPDHPHYYTEIVNFLGLKFDEATAAEEATFSCTALFSKYDFLKLERIVGSERAKKMCAAQKNVFMFA
ncbi:rRNA-binding ribosome biosynthesis protein utp25 [Apophysomyces ossiformis]|uniref:U3 small nucleolar RNA-associated protein 25 n=1 Tax=Apophysomyces ossiformis TaxID=679940 RepID=A0A8H7BV95_9FUNG|nr:rRNA-binding ribosome biosynthesis protein utp25 [Apophysomyces ossiformis]